MCCERENENKTKSNMKQHRHNVMKILKVKFRVRLSGCLPETPDKKTSRIEIWSN